MLCNREGLSAVIDQTKRDLKASEVSPQSTQATVRFEVRRLFCFFQIQWWLQVFQTLPCTLTCSGSEEARNECTRH